MPSSWKPLLLLSGYLGRAGTQMLLLWTFARQGGAAGAGDFAFALGVAAPVFTICELALRNVYQTLRDAAPFRVFLLIRLLSAAAATAVVLTASVVVPRFPSFGLLIPLLVMRFADSVLDICLGRLQFESRIGAAAASMWANTSLTVVAVVIVVLADEAAEFAVVGSAAASVLVSVVVAVWLATEVSSSWFVSGAETRRIVGAGASLGFAQALASFLAYLPVYYLNRAASPETVGVFAACLYVVTLSNLIFNSGMQTFLSPMRREFEARGRPGLESASRRVGGVVVAAGIAFGSVVVVLLPQLLPVVFGPEFQIGVSTALLFAVAIALLGVDYAAAGPLLVLNLYGSRITAAALGVLLAGAWAVISRDAASVETAAWLTVLGIAGRAGFSSWQWLRVRSA